VQLGIECRWKLKVRERRNIRVDTIHGDLPLPFAILETMGSRASRTIGTFALLTCLICPILETLDRWDPPIQTGNDTEYTLVIVALCVGAAYLFTRLISKSSQLGVVAKRATARCVRKPLISAPCSTLLFYDTGPPPLPLRV